MIVKKKIYVLLALALLLRIFLAPLVVLELDFNTFIAWSQRLASTPLPNFYNVWSDYLPGYLYFLWGLGKVNDLVSSDPRLLYKLPAILADLATGFLIYKIVSETSKKHKNLPLIASAAYLFNPAILANSTLWGQVDSMTAFFSLLAIWTASKKTSLSAVALSVGTLIKPQTAFVAPVILLIAARNKWKVRKYLTYALVGVVIFVAAFIPFLPGGPLHTFILERLSTTASQYPYTSVNAFNFWGGLGFWKSDTTGSISAMLIGYLLTGVAVVLGLLGTIKQKKSPYFLASFVLLASFMFLTRLHERHLLPALAPLAVVAALNPFYWIVYGAYSLTYTLNLTYSFVWITQDFKEVFSPAFVKALVAINVIALAVMFFGAKERAKKIWPKAFSGKYLITKSLVKKRGGIILAFILAFSLVVRVLFLPSPGAEYFDEVYHAFTARRILNNDAKAWEWWNTPPEGFAYEWTHPPLAKILMSGSMKIVGENSFGWRIPGALLGVGTVAWVYLIAKFLFKDEITALLSTTVYALDGLPLVMSRIAMNDIYFLFFALGSIYFFLKEKYFLSAALLGFAASSKWTAAWVLPVLGVIFISQRRKLINLRYLWFLVLPPVIYLATYAPQFLSGHNFDIFIGMQKQMWWYHTGLVAQHAYTSKAWSWPLLLRPVWLYTTGVKDGLVGNIYAMGNPIVFWGGLVAVVIAAIYSFLERNKNLALVIFAYLVFFIPWMASPRIMFLYHYLPSIPFLAIATGFVLKKHQKLIPAFLILSFIAFGYFFPHWTGIKIPVELDNSYYWVTSWR